MKTQSESLVRLAAFVDRLRPADPADVVSAEALLRAEAARLRDDPERARLLAADIHALLDLPSPAEFFAEAGIRSAVGSWLEVIQRVVRRFLPPVPDRPGLPEALDAIFRDRRDHRWVGGVAPERWIELLEASGLDAGAAGKSAVRELREAMRLLSYRLAGSSLDRELLRADPGLERDDSPFLSQNERLMPLLERTRDGGVLPTPEEAAPIHRDLEECRRALDRIRSVVTEEGASVRITSLLHGLRQKIGRLERMLSLLASETPLRPAVSLFRELLGARQRQHDVLSLAGEDVSILARNVTEHAGRHGEHYIAESRSDWWAMARSAAGGGVIIALMALLKIRLSLLHLPPLAEGIAFGLNYGLGFVLIHLLGFTVATKQPAMTAATIAATLHGAGDDDFDRLAELVRNVIRTQFVAILGNVGLALPVAALLALAWSFVRSGPLCPPEKVDHLLHDLHPFTTGALVFAAIAGVGLFLSGLVSGYFDNLARYHRIPRRVAAAPWLRPLGERRGAALAQQVDAHFGAIVGNLFFGFYLGLVGAFRPLLGFPLDIRHVSFSSANLGTALAMSGFSGIAGELSWAVAGVVGIAVVNLVVSFSLALAVALKSRELGAGPMLRLGALVLRQFAAAPFSFVRPPSDTPASRAEH